MANLRAGRVVSVRVNPKDCQSILDLVEKLPVPFSQDMSFAQHVSLALSSLLETARQQGLLPEPDQFEYLNRMERFGFNRHSHGRKLAITETIGTLGSEFKAPVVNKPAEQGYVEPELTPDQRRAWTRIRELDAKQALAEQPGSGVVWSASDQAEYDRLAQQV